MSNEIRLSKEFVISYDGDVIAKCIDFTFEINRNTIDLTSLDSGSWREILADQKEWRITFNALVPKTGTNNYDAMLEELKDNDEPVTVSMSKRDPENGDKYEEGDAIITSLTFSASVGDRATYSGTLEGTGPLLTKTITITE